MATYNLGLIVTHDEPEKAGQLFQTAASAGQAKAMDALAKMLQSSKGNYRSTCIGAVVLASFRLR